MNQRYLVMYGHTANSIEESFAWGSSLPDLPGCVSVGDTLEEMRARMKEAVKGHLQAMAADGDPMPQPVATAIDFAEETSENSVGYCVVEYPKVELPAITVFPSQQVAVEVPHSALTVTS